MKLTAILSALTLLAAILCAQAPAAKPGSIDGVVTNSVTGEPLKKVQIALRTRDSQSTAITDATGHFHFDNVNPDSYSISAERPGFMVPGAPLGGPYSITVGDEQHVRDVALKLMPLGAISGHVLDDDGDPIVRAGVNVLRYVYGPGRKQLKSVAYVESNDLGEFEALFLVPGRYYIEATSAPPPNVPPLTRWAHSEQAYPLTFYPNASEATQATRVSLAPGAHLGNIDFRLHKLPAYHIRGTVGGVSASDAGPPSPVLVTVPDSDLGPNLAQSAVRRDGTFDLRGIVNGAYQLSYTHFLPGNMPSFSDQSVRVSDADVNGVVLTPRKPVEVSGSVTVEGPQPEKLEVQIVLSSLQGPDGNANSPVGPDGKFTLSALAKAYLLQFSNVPAGKYVKSIHFGDREIKNGEIDLTEGSAAALNIVLGADGGEIDGTVQNASGQPTAVILITLAPAEEYDGRSDLLKNIVTDASSIFQMNDVAPGVYQVLAWENDAAGGIQSSEFRKAFEDRSVAVTVGPKEKVSVQLNIITADDMEKGMTKLP
jgi:hypothetical protein